jgi:hypothetical protein
MHTSVTTLHCNKMAVNNILVHQCAVIEFHVKNNSAADIYGLPSLVFGDLCMDASSTRR